MQARLIAAALVPSLFLAACGGGSNSPRAVDTPPATNNDGSLVTGVITARFDPTLGVVPFPTNLLLSGTTDLTLNIPVADPNNYGDPRVAMNAQDGFGAVAPWSTTFSVPVKTTTVVAGSTVRVFQVTLTGPGGGVTGVTRELTPNVDYVATMASPQALAIVPLKPLQQLTSYMAVLTDNITDSRGNDATPDQTYFLAQSRTPLCINGVSQQPLLSNAQACALEPLRQLTNSQEAAAAAAGVNRSQIVLTWVATVQSITPVLGAVQARTAATPATTIRIAPTGLTLAQINPALPPIADVFTGSLDLPYYLTAPTATECTPTTACPPLTQFWHAAPGAYIPPFQGLLNPTSTFVTFANPLPIATSTQKVPLVLTIPNTASGKIKPATGWPIIIFQHGITRNRTDAFAVAGTLASQGFAVIAIDAPLHGLTNAASPLYGSLGSTERTFNIDLINNTTGAAGPDGVPDPSGTYFINLPSLLTSRDNIREAVADLSQLTRAIPAARYTAGAGIDFDASRIGFVGQSLGGIIGTVFMGVNPNVQTALLNVPGGGIANLLEASPTFGPRIRAGLAGLGLQPGTADYAAFFVAAQTVIDSADPINWAYTGNNSLNASKNLLLQEVVGGGAIPPDQVIPNSVAGAPLSGTEPLIRILGLSSITQTTQSATGIRGAVRFVTGSHGSLLDPAASPTASPAATAEMQGEMASMHVSGGHAVQITIPSVIKTQ